MISRKAVTQIVDNLLEEVGKEKAINIVRKLQTVDGNKSFRDTMCAVRVMLGKVR